MVFYSDNDKRVFPKQDKFISFLELRDYSKDTIKSYLLYYNKVKDLDLDQDKVNDLCQKYNHNLFRSFLRLYLYEFLKNKDIEISITRGRKERKIPKHLTKEEIDLLLGQASERESLMISLMFEGGLRVSELINLTINDFDLENNKIKVYGKGRKERIVKFTDLTKRFLMPYLEMFKAGENIFDINRKRVWVIIKKMGMDILEKEVNPHMFRHSTATHMRKMGMDLKEIQEYLGLTRLETVGIYAHIVRPELDEKWEGAFE